MPAHAQFARRRRDPIHRVLAARDDRLVRMVCHRDGHVGVSDRVE